MTKIVHYWRQGGTWNNPEVIGYPGSLNAGTAIAAAPSGKVMFAFNAGTIGTGGRALQVVRRPYQILWDLAGVSIASDPRSISIGTDNSGNGWVGFIDDAPATQGLRVVKVIPGGSYVSSLQQAGSTATSSSP